MPDAGIAGETPAGQRAREFGDVVLAIAAAHAERVQLHDLAREVLVQAAFALRVALRRAQRRHAVRSDRTGLVEKQLHGRMTFDRHQHVLEAAEHVRADRFRFERAGQCGDAGLSRRRPRSGWPRNARAVRRMASAWSTRSPRAHSPTRGTGRGFRRAGLFVRLALRFQRWAGREFGRSLGHSLEHSSGRSFERCFAQRPTRRSPFPAD